MVKMAMCIIKLQRKTAAYSERFLCLKLGSVLCLIECLHNCKPWCILLGSQDVHTVNRITFLWNYRFMSNFFCPFIFAKMQQRQLYWMKHIHKHQHMILWLGHILYDLNHPIVVLVLKGECLLQASIQARFVAWTTNSRPCHRFFHLNCVSLHLLQS